MRLRLEEIENPMPEGEFIARITDIQYIEGEYSRYKYFVTLLSSIPERDIYVNVFQNNLHDLLSELYFRYNIPSSGEIDLSDHVDSLVRISLSIATSSSGKRYYTLNWYEPYHDDASDVLSI